MTIGGDEGNLHDEVTMSPDERRAERYGAVWYFAILLVGILVMLYSTHHP